MLLFIPGYRWTSRASILFQYISCYSLSKEGIDNMKDVRSFNTSHVTLYRENTLEAIREKLVFQYISCYSLSWGRRQPTEQTDVSIHLMLLFIEDELSKIADSGRFNTSHVTLYQFQKMCRIKSKSCFNTSHVTLYLKSPVRDLLSRYRFNTSHVTLYRIMIN